MQYRELICGLKTNFEEDSVVYREYVGFLIEGNQVRGSVFYVIDETNCPIKGGSKFV